MLSLENNNIHITAFPSHLAKNSKSKLRQAHLLLSIMLTLYKAKSNFTEVKQNEFIWNSRHIINQDKQARGMIGKSKETKGRSVFIKF